MVVAAACNMTSVSTLLKKNHSFLHCCDQLPYMNRQVPLEDIEIQEEGHEQYTISNARSEES